MIPGGTHLVNHEDEYGYMPWQFEGVIIDAGSPGDSLARIKKAASFLSAVKINPSSDEDGCPLTALVLQFGTLLGKEAEADIERRCAAF